MSRKSDTNSEPLPCTEESIEWYITKVLDRAGKELFTGDDHQNADTLALLSIVQSLDKIDTHMRQMVKNLVRIATALEQKSHECP